MNYKSLKIKKIIDGIKGMNNFFLDHSYKTPDLGGGMTWITMNCQDIFSKSELIDYLKKIGHNSGIIIINGQKQKDVGYALDWLGKISYDMPDEMR